ncbi:MAG: HAD-IA family hydrolase [Hydrogenophaga sp.]|jgi:phosphoglycolate phosphatase|nr:HAD-IA family hydrolase [Hydrogenophaga sp.]
MRGHDWRGIEALLFDLDGTLIDSAPDLGAAANAMRMCRKLAPLPLSLYRAHAGSGARGMLNVAFRMTPENDQYETLRVEFLQQYESCMLERTMPFAGVPALLLSLQSKCIPWAIVTNKAERLALPLVAALPDLQHVATVVGGDTTPHAKPHPAPLLEAARRLNLDPERCAYVGDDARDIAAGKAAGMLTVAACYGYLGPDADVSQWGAHAEVLHPLEILKLFDLP